jgi:hypothetical protein
MAKADLRDDEAIRAGIARAEFVRKGKACVRMEKGASVSLLFVPKGRSDGWKRFSRGCWLT